MWYFDKRGVDVDEAFGGVLPSSYHKCRVTDVVSGRLAPLKSFAEVKGIENIILCPDERMDELRAVARQPMP
jgi:hypothetical protein